MPTCHAQNPALKFEYCEPARGAVIGAHAAVLVTEWDEFRRLDLYQVAGLMQQPVFIDGRNLYDPETARAAGLDYSGIGARSLRARSQLLSSAVGG